VISRAGLAFAIVAFVSSISPAATSKQYNITKDAQAVAVAAKAFAAMGGTQALLSYQDSQATGTLTVYPQGSTPVNYPITIKTKTTQLTRVEVQESKGTNIRILNTGQAAIQRPDGTVIQLLMNNTFAERVRYIPLLSILAEYSDSDIQLLYQGTSQVNGQSTDSIATSLVPTTDSNQAPIYASMTQASFYVDQSTSMVDKIQYNNFSENDPAASELVEVYFAKYQTINGMSVPYQITTYSDGVLESEVVLQSIDFNVGLPDSDFTLPK